jgi:hypothetical protein
LLVILDAVQNLRIRFPQNPLLEPSMRSDTRQLLRVGLGLFLTGAAAALLALTVCGGIGRQGPHTNSGWFALMIAMGCLPTGTLTLALALAKLIGDRKR